MASKPTNAATHPFYNIYEERRQYPRVVVDVPVAILTQNKTAIRTVAHDISPDAMQIRCDRVTAYSLHPSGKSLSHDNGPEVDVRLHLPLQNGPSILSARCQLFYIAVRPDGDIAFGLNFVKFEGNGSQILSQFVEESIVPVLNGHLGTDTHDASE